MNDLHVISIILMAAGALIMCTSIFRFWRSGSRYMDNKQTKLIITVSCILSASYVLLIILFIKKILSADLLAGGLALVCSCFIAVMAAANRSVANRLQKEIAEHEISREKINDLSLTDPVTRLYNRRGFLSIVEKHLIRLRRNKKKAIIFYLELDNLDEVNRKSGYEEGDKILANVGTLMTAAFRQADVIARLGNDEFIAFLVDADIENKEAVKNNFQETLQTYNEKRSSQFKLSVHYAVSDIDPVINESVSELISKASVPVKQKKKKQQSSRCSLSDNAGNNFTLIVSNMSIKKNPVDIQIYIDGELVIDDTFAPGMQNAWKPFHFKLTKGKHSIKAKSLKGRTTLQEEFKIRRDHWASIEYNADNASVSGAHSVSGKLFFKLQDVPLEHKLVRPVKKFV